MSVDMTTSYLGFRLDHPIVASAGPATGHADSLERLAEADVAAVVLPSLFEEELTHAGHEVEGMLSHGAGAFAEAQTFLPEPAVPFGTPDQHLEVIAQAKQHLDVPIIASLNGATAGGWTEYASELIDAGADAIELNVYIVAADIGENAADVEQRYLDVVRAVRDAVDAPLAVKLSPYFTALASFARDVVDAGADGLVLFNRFYQPDVDLDTLEVAPRLQLSTGAELRLPMRWIAILHGRVNASLALSTGVHEVNDVVKAMLVGADAIMTTSALLVNGPEFVATLRDGLEEWLDEREYESVAQATGSVSQKHAADPDAFERSNYVDALRRWSTHIRV